MSSNGTALPIAEAPDAEALTDDLVALVYGWPDPTLWRHRSDWLRAAEDRLQASFPLASGADLRLTARGLAPFQLLDGPNVP